MTVRSPFLFTLIAGAGTIAAVIALGGVAHLAGFRLDNPAPPAPTVTASPYSIPGRILLAAGEFTTAGQTCAGTRPDLREGAQVVVSDSTGASVAYAELGAGVMTDGRCGLPFRLEVPPGSGTYGVDVAGYGQLLYSEADMQELLELTIG